MKHSRKRALRRDFSMEIRKTFNRFASIFLISALGAAFFAGVRATPGDMELSADTFYDDTNLMDIRIVGTLGMTQADADAMAELPLIEQAVPMYQSDVMYEQDNSEMIIRVLTYSEEMNGYHITGGRAPEKAGECLADETFLMISGKQIGDTITVSSGTKDPIEDTLTTDTYTIVGSGTSPLYMSYDRGISSIGTGSVDAWISVTEESFSLEAYTDLYLTVSGAREFGSYSETYKDLVAEAITQAEALEEERCLIRYEEVLADPEAELEDARAELADGEEEADRELADARAKLEDARQELDDGWAEYEDGRAELEDARAELEDARAELEDARQQIEDGRAELESARTELADARAEIEDRQEQLDAARAELEAGQAEYDTNRQAFEEASASLAASEEELAAGEAQAQAARVQLEQSRTQLQEQRAQLEPYQEQMPQEWQQLLAAEELLSQQEEQLAVTEAQLAAARTELEAGKQELAANEELLNQAAAELESGRTELEDGERQLADALAEVESGEQTLAEEERRLSDAESAYEEGLAELADAEQTIAENETQLADAEQELLDGEQEYSDGQAEYEEARLDAEAELADAREQIMDAEAELNDIKVPEWYIYDRDDITSVYDFGQDAQRIAAIGEVFPAIFFLVAALVSLTTMTRMVDEERIQIGTLKALGYSRRDIAFKYIMYGVLASFGGSVAGVLIGEWIFPYIIASTYANLMYTGLPRVYTPLNLFYAVTATLITTACTVAATYFACAHELKAQPASLMRPAPPRSGKRVFLEKIPFLWKHFNFNWKSTIRNLLRYKKRFFMTVFGIGGCMALLLVGFGIKDSVGMMADLQYSELWFQDLMVTLDTEANKEDLEALTSALDADDRIQRMLLTDYQTEDMAAGEETRSVTVMVFEDSENLDVFFCFRDTRSGEVFELTDNGVIITEKLSRLLNVETGDTVTLSEGAGTEVEVTITAITEHYLQHYCYMTADLYRTLYGENPEYNQCLLVLNDSSQSTTNALARDILNYDAALAVSQTNQFQETVDNMLNGINVVVYVLIVAAGLLAFVVLYNLNNININERKRELATLKVLGFYNQETAVYVYRENFLLTIIGILFGMGLGVVLHRFIMQTVEVDMVMFGREILPMSFLYSTLLTFGFSVFICLVMYNKIRRINMVESLKSVE